MRVQTIKFLTQLLTSQHLTISGNQLASVVEALRELSQDEIEASKPPAPPEPTTLESALARLKIAADDAGGASKQIIETSLRSIRQELVAGDWL